MFIVYGFGLARFLSYRASTSAFEPCLPQRSFHRPSPLGLLSLSLYHYSHQNHSSVWVSACIGSKVKAALRFWFKKEFLWALCQQVRVSMKVCIRLGGTRMMIVHADSKLPHLSLEFARSKLTSSRAVAIAVHHGILHFAIAHRVEPGASRPPHDPYLWRCGACHSSAIKLSTTCWLRHWR